MEGHRQRLKHRFQNTNGSGVADYELLELALTFAIPRRDVKPLAKHLLEKFGSLSQVLTAPPEDLAQINGLGPSSVIFIQVIQQLAVRTRREKLQGKPLLASRLELLDYLYTLFQSKPREEFHVLYLNTQLQLITDETLFTGTLTETVAAPREILKRALSHNAAGMVVAHNHPSGTPTPS
ncbi:MAG: DNA repair protein RadC, partial [Proteobacteria bacterium]|nr:DNA repair protein RadC [Pseudomonadota bacterium]